MNETTIKSNKKKFKRQVAPEIADAIVMAGVRSGALGISISIVHSWIITCTLGIFGICTSKKLLYYFLGL
jgi:hypothetical protein